jgi:hypothetical protein
MDRSADVATLSGTRPVADLAERRNALAAVMARDSLSTVSTTSLLRWIARYR